jgi:hypothetical protein
MFLLKFGIKRNAYRICGKAIRKETTGKTKMYVGGEYFIGS